MELLRGSRRRRVVWAGTLLALTSLSGATALTACRKSEPPAPVLKVAPAPAPVRPPEVIFEVTVPAPQEFWPRLRSLAGPIGEVMPRGPELALCDIASIPPLSAGLLDLASPVVLVWLGGDAPGFVLGVHLESGPELVAQVSTGTHPTHRLQRRGSIGYLSPASGAGFAFAVASDTLLLGSERAVERAGDYVARSLRPRAPTQGAVALDVIGAGLKSWLVPALTAAWAGRRAALVEALGREQNLKGRPADFADPAAMLAALDGFVHGGLDVVGSTREAHGELNMAGHGVTVALRVVPDAEGAARALFSSLRPGRADHARELPPSAALAVFYRQGENASSASDLLSALFGARLGAAESTTLRRSLERLRTGRGAAEAFALMPDLSVVWRGDVTEPTAFSAALQGLLPLVARPPIADALGSRVGRPSLLGRRREQRGDETIERARIRLTPQAGGLSTAKAFEVTSLVGARRFVVTLGKEGTAPLDAALGAEAAGAGLGAVPTFAPLLSEKDDVAWLVAADLSRLGLAPADAGATVGAGVSVDDGALRLRFRASDSAVRALGARVFGR